MEKYYTAGQPADDDTTLRMRFACRITTSTDTHSEYVILVAFPLNSGYANALLCYVTRRLPAKPLSALLTELPRCLCGFVPAFNVRRLLSLMLNNTLRGFHFILHVQ